jgi:hypothetical protein
MRIRREPGAVSSWHGTQWYMVIDVPLEARNDWLPECNPLPNRRLENRKDARFSGVLTGRGVSKSHYKII